MTFKMFDAKEVAKLRERYKEGTKVQLIFMSDIQAPPRGTLGTVTGVDDIGTVHVNWENGSTLGLVPGEDQFLTVLNTK